MCFLLNISSSLSVWPCINRFLISFSDFVSFSFPYGWSPPVTVSSPVSGCPDTGSFSCVSYSMSLRMAVQIQFLISPSLSLYPSLLGGHCRSLLLVAPSFSVWPSRYRFLILCILLSRLSAQIQVPYLFVFVSLSVPPGWSLPVTDSSPASGRPDTDSFSIFLYLYLSLSHSP